MRFKLKFKLYINSVIALVTLKLSIGSKKLPKFYMTQFLLSIGYRKIFKVKPEFDPHSYSKPNHFLLSSLILLRRYFYCKHCKWKNSKTHSNFYQPPRMISWDIDKSHNFRTLFSFFRILKSFEHTFMVVFPRQDVRNFFLFGG